jgi:hypothetical protein
MPCDPRFSNSQITVYGNVMGTSINSKLALAEGHPPLYLILSNFFILNHIKSL